MASEAATSSGSVGAGAAGRSGQDVPWCPSSRPEPGSVVFAVRTADPERAGVRYLDAPVPTTATVLALADPVDPREVFRFGAPCATHECAHFTGTRCSLVERLVGQLPPAVDELPACRIRARCRWFAEEGPAACVRCPMVLTLQRAPEPAVAEAAAPLGRDEA